MKRSLIGRSLLPTLALAATLAACDEGTTGPPVPAQLNVVGGAEQNAVVNTELPQALTVQLLDARGRPVANQTVNFQVVTGGGSLTVAAAQTDANGVASTRWRLGTSSSGIQRAQATVAGVGGAANFIAIGLPGPVANLELRPPAFVNPPFPGDIVDSLAVMVRDAFGNLIPGVAVTFTARGGGTVSPATGTTTVDGIFRTRWTLGLRVDSVQVLQASAASVNSQLVVVAPHHPDATVEMVSGGGQTAEFGDPLPQPVVVRVTDLQGRPLQGALVQATTDYGGTVTSFRARTAANGTASFQWTLGPSLTNQLLHVALIIDESRGEHDVVDVPATAHP